MVINVSRYYHLNRMAALLPVLAFAALSREYVGAASFFIFLIFFANSVQKRYLAELMRPLYSIWPLCLIIIIMIIRTSENADFLDIARDLSFMSTAVLAPVLGVALSRLKGQEVKLFTGIFYIASAISLYLLFKLSIQITDFSLIEVRSISGGTGDLGVIAIIVLIFYRAVYLSQIRSLIVALCGLTIGIAAIITQSRTMIFLLIVFFLVYHFDKLKYRFQKLIFIVSLLVVTGLLFYASLVADPTSYDLIGKLARSAQELLPNASEENIHSNWRSVESGIALAAFANEGWGFIFAGGGLGYRLDLGFTMILGDNEFESIPIFHSGYVYVLMKSGFVGFFLLGLQFIKWWSSVKKSRILAEHEKTLGKFLILGSAGVLAFGGGFIQNSALIMILVLGALLGKRSVGSEKRRVVAYAGT